MVLAWVVNFLGRLAVELEDMEGGKQFVALLEELEDKLEDFGRDVEHVVGFNALHVEEGVPRIFLWVKLVDKLLERRGLEVSDLLSVCVFTPWVLCWSLFDVSVSDTSFFRQNPGGVTVLALQEHL